MPDCSAFQSALPAKLSATIAVDTGSDLTKSSPLADALSHPRPILRRVNNFSQKNLQRLGNKKAAAKEKARTC